MYARFLVTVVAFCAGIAASAPVPAAEVLTDAQLDTVTAGNLVSATLPDGRIEMWWTSNGQVLSIWQTSTDPNAPWTLPSGTSLRVPVTDLSVTSLPDKRLQLFAAGPYGVFTTQKLTTDPNSGWTSWQRVTPS